LLSVASIACGTLSVQEERRMGEQVVHETKSQVRLVHDRVVRDYVADIGKEVLDATGPQPFDYNFYVVDDDQINAFALPGGHIFVHTGVILRARNVSELAGVIGHEIGHVERRHIARNYNKMRAGSLAQQVLTTAGGLYAGDAGRMAGSVFGGMAVASVVNTFTREAEREADDFAVIYLPRAGYDPHGLPTFFQTIMREGGSRPPEFLSSHPSTENRLSATRKAIDELDLPPGLLINDGGKFEIIQRRVRLLTGSRSTGHSTRP
jgi:predicted Zn-dependent protease